jgi:ABC-2 type transport system permease protein
MSAALSGRQAVLLVARREFVTQVRSRSFVIGIVFTLVIFAAVAGVSVFVSSQTEERSIGLTPSASALQPVLEDIAAQQEVTLRVVEVDEEAGRTQVADDELDALLSGGGSAGYQLLYRDAVDSSLTPLVATAAQQDALSTALTGAGVDPASLTGPATVTPSTIEPADPQRGQQLTVALGGTFLLFMGLQYAAGVASGVVEEKQSRVVELLLATIKPWHLLTGKVIGIGAAGLLTMVILGSIAGVAASAAGLLTLPSAAAGMLVMVLVWYLIGFFLYAAVYAALGSTVSRQEELQSLIAPMIFLVLIPFILTLNLLPNDPRNPILAVLSFVPFLSQTVMPARYALGVAPLWEVAVSALIAVAAIGVVVRVAARIYRNSILRTGARVGLLEALRSR